MRFVGRSREGDIPVAQSRVEATGMSPFRAWTCATRVAVGTLPPMSAVDGTIYLTEEEYIEGERHSEVRHELVGWQAWAMAGASEEHNFITGNLFTATELAKPLAQWPVRAAYGDLFAIGATTILTAVPGDGPQRLFAVLEQDAPPANQPASRAMAAECRWSQPRIPKSAMQKPAGSIRGSNPTFPARWKRDWFARLGGRLLGRRLSDFVQSSAFDFVVRVHLTRSRPPLDLTGASPDAGRAHDRPRRPRNRLAPRV